MALRQTILFTVMPRAMTVNPDPMPVSVFVSPRLEGAATLGAFADWVRWTERLRDGGLELELRCAGRTLGVPIDPGPLRPELWAQLFDDETLVRSHTFDDYSDRGVISYPVREALSALKAIYQQASVDLALPDAPAGGNDRQGGNRAILRRLVDGLEVHWNGVEARRWREVVRLRAGTSDRAGSVAGLSGPLDGEGLFAATPDRASLQGVAVRFSVFHHMPTPSCEDVPLALDPATVLDFHQALTALNSYPDLLRALGLVFDLDLPRDFVAETPLGQTLTLAVAGVTGAREWALPPATPALETAYAHLRLGPDRFFFTAPRAVADPQAPTTVLGLLSLDPERFGLAQVDVDGGLHKAIMLAETVRPPPGHNLVASAGPEAAPHPEVFDPEATLPSLRSGGVSLFADRRALALLDSIAQSKAFNAVAGGGAQPRPFYAEDLVRGYRLDVWDSETDAWHSLHRREAEYSVGELPFAPSRRPEEGFVQLAATQPAPGALPATDDLYVHEAIARWAGWSLSAPMPAKHLSRYPDAAEAVPDGSPKFAEDEPITPFKVVGRYRVAPGTLPRLRFGTRYRLRARPVDLAGNSLELGDPLADRLSAAFALPVDPEGFAYLRYEPVPAPVVVLRDPRGVTGPGSAVERIVLRTFNTVGRDTTPADPTAADRHILPPRASVEMGQRLGMFDDAAGRLKADAATWKLIGERDAGELPATRIDVAGKTIDNEYPLVAAAMLEPLPFLPDRLARGAAFRDLPGTPSGTVGRAGPDVGGAAPVDYAALSDPNPRPGSATLVSYAGSEAWEDLCGFRLALAEPAPGQTDPRPGWDPIGRVLTVYLPKGQSTTVPLTSFIGVDELKLMGVWQWLREYVEAITVNDPQQQVLDQRGSADRIAHVLQRAVEGGHWMLTPPRLITLVHAVQQPLGHPELRALSVGHDDANGDPTLQTAPDRGRTDPSELASITAWRRLGATDAVLLGALRVHGASTAKVDLLATWTDPTDDQAEPGTSTQSAAVEELPLRQLREGYLRAAGQDDRAVGYYDPEHDQIAFVRAGDQAGTRDGHPLAFGEAAPRHRLGDVKRHVVTYTAVASSRYREYFDPDQVGGFTRASKGYVVDVPASARPLAPDVAYVLPTFGWERQVETNLKRSVRFGGGLRVYLHRPWFSSGAGELLGVALWSGSGAPLDAAGRDRHKPFFTQWGMDPIWDTGGLAGAPDIGSFPDAVESDRDVSLEEASARTPSGEPGRIDVVGFEPEFDKWSGLWFADLTIDTSSETYMPFVRLALVRYQPHALADARVSRVVLADFAQLTPDRSAMVTADPYHPRTLRVAISGVAPRGPRARVHAEPLPRNLAARPTQIEVRVQRRVAGLESDLAWEDVEAGGVEVQADFDGPVPDQPDLILWAGSVTFARQPVAGELRLLVEEREFISADHVVVEDDRVRQPSRVIYAETVLVDEALVG
ncbi:MAG: hypothetical protein QOD61_2011 [Solirubrobacteraceae bacterium]|nr:hypothetical protein [Solirubrobacteraceae bacterium]